MRKAVLGGLLLARLVAALRIHDARRHGTAAGPGPAPRGAWDLALEGPGSSIGVTVRDQNDGAGVLIESVREGTPATRAGLQKGDVVLEFDGERSAKRAAVHASRPRNGSWPRGEDDPDARRSQTNGRHHARSPRQRHASAVPSSDGGCIPSAAAISISTSTGRGLQ